MLVTNPAVRATLFEVLEHPWMCRGFSGSPDSHLVHREPLRADELDRQVIKSMKGFEFGSEDDIERRLVQILESEPYLRAVSAWNRKRGRNGTSNRWGETFSNSSLSISYDGSTHQKSDVSGSPSKKSTKRFSGLDFYRRKLFSPAPSPPVTPSHSPPTSQSHLSINDYREPPDPTRGFHPLISIYYLAREKMERERVYGPGHFASSQVSITNAAAGGPSAPDDASALPGYSSKALTAPQMARKEPSAPVSAKADYSMPLPRLPAPETSHYSGMSYDAASAAPATPVTPSFHSQPRPRDAGLPAPPPSAKSADVGGPPVTSASTMPLPRAPPASTHRRSHSMSQRPTVLRGLGSAFGAKDAGGGPVDERPEEIPVPHTAGPEFGGFSIVGERDDDQQQQQQQQQQPSRQTLHDGPLSAGATLVKRFGTLLVGRGENEKKSHGSIGKRTTIVGGIPLKLGAHADGEKEDKATDADADMNGTGQFGERRDLEPNVRRQNTYSPPPISASQSQPPSHTYRRAATILDPQGRTMRHERRSSTGGTFLPSFGGTIGRHRRPSTGYGAGGGRSAGAPHFARTEEVEENVDDEFTDGRGDSDKDQHHADKGFKPVHLKGLFRYVFLCA